jgi:hypothetical protein
MTVATEVEEHVRRGPVEVVEGVDEDGVTVLDEDCNDEGVCVAQRFMTQTLTADVLFVFDTHEGMEPFLDTFAGHVYALGAEIDGLASDLHVGVINMDASGELFEANHRSYLAAGTDEGARQVEAWVQSAVDGLPATDHRGLGRDSVVALLIDSADADVQEDEVLSVDTADTGTKTKLEPQRESSSGWRGDGSGGPIGAFRRDKVPLNIVFVSRTEDESVAAMETFDRALDLTADASRRRMHAVVGVGRSCHGVGAVEEGTSYRALAETSGGVVVDLCHLSRSALSDLGRSIADSGLARVHKLPSDLDPSKPVRLEVRWPNGAMIDMLPSAYTILPGPLLLQVHEPPPVDSVFTLHYERVPKAPPSQR